MTGLLILLGALGIPYVGFNVRRLRRGRSWAFTICQVAKEWEEREQARHKAARVAKRSTPRRPAGRPAPRDVPDS